MMNTDVLNAFKKKRYWQIGEIAERLSIETYTLRYWEENVPELKPLPMRERRLYGFDQITLIVKLYNLVILQGFMVQGAVKNLNSCAVSSKMDDVVARLNKIICLFEQHESQHLAVV